jgi:HAD superfamily hydrolase (TIGR01450 family)
MTTHALARLRACKAFLLDMDGTIYVDERLLPGALALISHLDERRLPYLFLTNNSASSGEVYRQRLSRLGIRVERERILTSGDATISFLLSETPHRSAYLVGTPALEADFRAQGLDLDAEDPDCVVVAFDTTLTFAKLERACALLFRGKPYYATHPDKTCITARGLIPDIAAIIAACEAVTGRTPQIIGKPSPEIVRAALSRLGGARAEATAMVGDQLDTDMTMARRAGLVGVLVLSGETKPERLSAAPEAERPMLCLENVGELLSLLGGSAARAG